MTGRLVSLTLSNGSRVSDCPLMLSAEDMVSFFNFDSINQFHRWRHRVGLEFEPGTRKYSTISALQLLTSIDRDEPNGAHTDPGIAALDEAGL